MVKKLNIFQIDKVDGQQEGEQAHAKHNPYSNSSSGAQQAGGQQSTLSRHEGNMKEASALNRVSGALDEYIEAGLASLSDLRDQTATLKGTQERLRDVAVKMGLSSGTIRFIEQRTKGARYVFYGGCFLTLVAFFSILRYFG
ncbi:hypothetical protein BCR37DRAFT_394951 [Protomyces lactucae-debilis]|uniref:Uncharacterized protein n=1 Tax=Protomyces lactucae-debilis TaxID=2754530 RepID=A0A1Y2F1V2_PROLT|nr:uncharacterized protein BCR37DRAFT_394951 [Protomyces lactucae-debilis]ORY77326.1 hypothetical protein BCR37DRAFT_394951 [Protomyces lactucae-debilis]